jgi:hypothetical protein
MDYLNIFLIICCCTFISRVAEAEKRRGWLWGSISLVLTLLLGKVIESSILVFVSSIIVSYITMFVANLLRTKPKCNW